MIYNEDWVLYSINTAPPVGSCHAAIWISLEPQCIMCQLIRAQRSCFTNGCSIILCLCCTHIMFNNLVCVVHTLPVCMTYSAVCTSMYSWRARGWPLRGCNDCSESLETRCCVLPRESISTLTQTQLFISVVSCRVSSQ